MKRVSKAFRKMYLGSDLMESILSAQSDPAELDGEKPERPAEEGDAHPRVKMMSAEDVMAIALGQVDAPLGGGEVKAKRPEPTEAPEAPAPPAPAAPAAPPEEPVSVAAGEPFGDVATDVFGETAEAGTDFTEARTKTAHVDEPETKRFSADSLSAEERTGLLATGPHAPVSVAAPAAGAATGPVASMQAACTVERFASAELAAKGPDAERLARSICAHRFEYGPSVVFTSAFRAEGKTALATAVALAAARSGVTTVLVDAALASANASRMVTPEPAAGLLDLLEGRADLSGVLVTSATEGLWMIPSPGGTPAGAPIIASEAMSSLVSRLHSAFELVVIAAPSVDEEPAVAGLAAMAGGVILAVKARSTGRGEVGRAIEELESAGARMMGLVLTYVPGPGRVPVGAAALP